MPFDGKGFEQASTTQPDQQRDQLRRDLNVLMLARQSLAQRGKWCQGTMANEKGARCVWGWLQTHTRPDHAEYLLHEHLDPIARNLNKRVFPDSGHATVRFNDSYRTRKRDVIELMDMAIALIGEE